MLQPRFVDTREDPSRLRPLERAGFTPKALQAGDVQFPTVTGEVVLVENKKMRQFLEDLSSGQLARQLYKMVEVSSYSTLMIEGHWTVVEGKLAGSNYTWAQVWNYLQGAQDIGVRIQLTTSAEHTVQRICDLADWYAKDYHAATGRHPAGDKRVSVLSNIYGIDTEKAKVLLEHFGDLEGVVTADLKALQEAKGIGQVLSKRVHEFWRNGTG